MAEQTFEFRALLIQLSNQLSDNQREELHFIVGSIVPRKVRDDCTPSGTLRLLDFFIDRNLISNQHFDYLIYALREINFYDAVEQLEEFKRFQRQRTLSTSSTESTTLNELASNIEVDKMANIAKLVYVTKEGFWHGIQGKFIQNQQFDDAKDLMLTYTDRCIGVELYWIDKYLASIRFFYSNGRSSTVLRPSSDNLLDRVLHSFNNFTLHTNEEISKVISYERAYRLYTNDSLKNSQMKHVIIGIQFRTTKRRKSDLFGSDNGQFIAESFVDYTFRCAKGWLQNDKENEILQFVWMKPIWKVEKFNESPLYALETCSFSYISEMGNESRRATGVESSWYDLKREFNRKGENCRPGASYYRTISVEGPFLFAVVKDKYVFYHDAGKWTQYESANSIEFGVINSSSLHPPRLSSTSNQ